MCTGGKKLRFILSDHSFKGTIKLDLKSVKSFHFSMRCRLHPRQSV